ncbi:ATP-binding cassette domain-containing protein [Leadbetterella sp. DM7]|uniref:ABC transporter ATP-binding protein n=1 Tax=Leadbetterella sp. DM7 TaxID=3235085 RepID=UPI00349F019F
MISVRLDNAGKKFSREWIFRALNYEFKTGSPVAVTGPNGSGKSTLVKSVAGTIPLNEGSVSYTRNGQPVPEESWYRLAGISAPYLELIEEFTLAESIDFHTRFRPFTEGLTRPEFIARLGLEKHSGKYIRDFSSGMKQKLKLGFAFFTQNEVLILDEPTANIDQKGYEWYMEEVQKLVPERVVIISSNEPREYTFCTEQLAITDFKR